MTKSVMTKERWKCHRTGQVTSEDSVIPLCTYLEGDIYLSVWVLCVLTKELPSGLEIPTGLLGQQGHPAP